MHIPPTRRSFFQGLHKAGGLDLNGLRASYQPGDQAGLKLLDLAIYARNNRFLH